MKSVLPLATILVLHTVFILNNAYSIDHIDSLMHFAGGIALGTLVAGSLSLAAHRNWCPWPGPLLEAVLIISLVVTGAVTWECYEWLSDRYLGTLLQLTVDDTIKDLALGLMGGVVSAAARYCAHARAVTRADQSRTPLGSES
jgi:hypothetical protein